MVGGVESFPTHMKQHDEREVTSISFADISIVGEGTISCARQLSTFNNVSPSATTIDTTSTTLALSHRLASV